MTRQVVQCGLTVVVLAASACATAQQDTGDADLALAAKGEIELTVENYNFNDVTLYALAVGIRERVGRVRGSGRETFTFRWPRQSLQMEVVFLSGGRMVTETMPVVPGDRLDLIIEQVAGDRAVLRRGR